MSDTDRQEQLQAPPRQRAVWRFRVPFGDSPTVMDWPAGAVPSAADVIGDSIDIWAEVPDPDAPTKSKPFLILGTGRTFQHSLQHVATMMQPHHRAPDGRFVWHLYHNPSQGLAAQTWQNGRIVESRPA